MVVSTLAPAHHLLVEAIDALGAAAGPTAPDGELVESRMR